MNATRKVAAALVFAALTFAATLRQSHAMEDSKAVTPGAYVYTLTATVGQSTNSTGPTSINWNDGTQIILPKKAGFASALVILNLPAVSCTSSDNFCTVYTTLIVNGATYVDKFGNTPQAVSFAEFSSCCNQYEQGLSLVVKVPLSNQPTTLGAAWRYAGSGGPSYFAEINNYGSLSALLTTN